MISAQNINNQFSLRQYNVEWKVEYHISHINSGIQNIYSILHSTLIAMKKIRNISYHLYELIPLICNYTTVALVSGFDLEIKFLLADILISFREDEGEGVICSSDKNKLLSFDFSVSPPFCNIILHVSSSIRISLGMPDAIDVFERIVGVAISVLALKIELKQDMTCGKILFIIALLYNKSIEGVFDLILDALFLSMSSCDKDILSLYFAAVLRICSDECTMKVHASNNISFKIRSRLLRQHFKGHSLIKFNPTRIAFRRYASGG